MIWNRDDIDVRILLILDKLNEEDRETVQDYILDILRDLDEETQQRESYEEENSELESELDNVKYDLQNRCTYCDYANCMREIVKDQMYYTKSYDTKEKILDKIEHTLKYGSPEKIWM